MYKKEIYFCFHNGIFIWDTRMQWYVYLCTIIQFYDYKNKDKYNKKELDDADEC